MSRPRRQIASRSPIHRSPPLSGRSRGTGAGRTRGPGYDERGATDREAGYSTQLPQSPRRAVLLHFWLAYDHPFEDGNGRAARALFYWYMRTHGYWLVEYLSISRILRHAPSKYSRAFLLTEADDRDATYFIVYQLEVVQRAVEQLHEALQLVK